MNERQFLEIIMLKLPLPIAHIAFILFALPFIMCFTKDPIKESITSKAYLFIMINLIVFIYRVYKA